MMRRGGARASTPIDDGNVMASLNPSLPARTVDDGTVVVTSAEPVVLDGPADPSLAARLGAEAFGTFGLVLVILGAGLYLPLSNAGTLGVALFAGLVLAGLIAALGHVSGGHFNPAVSLGAAFSGRLSVVDLLLYWLAQVFGGVLAAAILFVTIPAALPALLGAADSRAFFALTANGWGTHSPLSALSSGQVTFDLKSALIIEVVATAVFVAVTIGVTSRRVAAGVGPFAVGVTLAAMLLVTGPVTRSIAARVTPTANGPTPAATRRDVTPMVTATKTAVATTSMISADLRSKVTWPLDSADSGECVPQPFAVSAKNARESAAPSSAGSAAGIVTNRMAAARTPPNTCASQ